MSKRSWAAGLLMAALAAVFGSAPPNHPLAYTAPPPAQEREPVAEEENPPLVDNRGCVGGADDGIGAAMPHRQRRPRSAVVGRAAHASCQRFAGRNALAAHALKRVNLVAPRHQRFMAQTYDRIAHEATPPPGPRNKASPMLSVKTSSK